MNDTNFEDRLISRRRVQQILGALWLLDGLLQLQPSMFTARLIDGVMLPAASGQPALIAATLQPMIRLFAHFLAPANATIALVQIILGVCLLGGRFARPILAVSVFWSLGVWYWGEGLGMLLTGQASALTGAPGPVLFYAILALAAWPPSGDGGRNPLPRVSLRRLLAAFWALAAVLQLQPFWWQGGRLARTIAENESPGTLNGAVFGGSLQWLAHSVAHAEPMLNFALIVLGLGLAIGLVAVRPERSRPFLAASIAASLLLWWATQGFGQLLTGTATDVNSGPLLVVLAIACWPRLSAHKPEAPRHLSVMTRSGLASTRFGKRFNRTSPTPTSISSQYRHNTNRRRESWLF